MPSLKIITATCETCQGSGDLICRHCSGNGSRYPELARAARCSHCSGTGIVECATCWGEGVTSQREEVEEASPQECHIFITDKSGKRFWNTSVSYGQHFGELNNMRRRLANDIRAVSGLDVASARIAIVIDGREVQIENDEASDAELLRESGL